MISAMSFAPSPAPSSPAHPDPLPPDHLAAALARAEHLAFEALDAAPSPTLKTPNGKTPNPVALDQLNSLTTTLYRLAAIRVALATTPRSDAPTPPRPTPLSRPAPTPLAPNAPVQRDKSAAKSSSAPPDTPDPLLRLILAGEKSLTAQYEHEHGLLKPKPPRPRNPKPAQPKHPHTAPAPRDSHFPDDIANTRNPFHLNNPFNRPHLPPLRPGATRPGQIQKSLKKITRDLENHAPAPPSPNDPSPQPPKRTAPSPTPATRANARPSTPASPIPHTQWNNLSPALQAQLQSHPTQKPKPPTLTPPPGQRPPHVSIIPSFRF